MNGRRLLKYGTAFAGISLATFYRQEISDVSIGLVRFGRAAFTVGKIVADYNKSLYSKNVNVSSEEYQKLASEVHQRSANQLLELCEQNGGAFIKVGQHLGALDYLIPFEYVKTMRVLHNHAPRSNYEDILNVMREDLKCELSEVFEVIEEEPIGTASLAQVHKAKLVDGTVVAVKVQHPLVKAYSKVDMKSMEFLADLVSWIFPDFKLQWLVNETKRNLPCELNFIMEGHNAEKTGTLTSHLPWLHVPKIHWQFSTERVLTMEYCNGVNIGDFVQLKDPKLETYNKEISHKITQLYSDMIFLHGYVHCDPHPGNIRIDFDARGKLVIHLLDHGLYLQLSNDIREDYARFWMSVIRSDTKEMESVAQKLGVGKLYVLFACMISGRSWNAIQGGIDKHGKTTTEEREIKDDASKYLMEIVEVLHRVPRQLLLIFKTNDLLRGLDSMLGIRDNTASYVTMFRSCANADYLKKYSQCDSLACKLRVYFSHCIAHFRITVYQIVMWWMAWRHTATVN
nr:EOG090X047B [Ilyocryptus agilis]